MGVGLGLCILSAALDFGTLSVTTSGGVAREVGDYHAVNWSVTYAIVFPVTLYFMLSAYQRRFR
jgi:hypothetical protein